MGAGQARYQDTDSQQISREMTLDEMAARIGSTREMVCRVLYQVADEGVIQINRTEFTISNSEILAQYAGVRRSKKKPSSHPVYLRICDAGRVKLK